MKVILMVAYVAASPLAMIGFEEDEGFAPGPRSEGIWTGGSVVDAAHSGAQSLEVPEGASVEHEFAGESVTAPVRWLDLWIKPVADASSEPELATNLGGARVAFISGQTGAGQLYVFDGDTAGGGESVALEREIALDDEGRAAEWIRLTIRKDVPAGMWDLFVDGRPVRGGLGLDGAASECWTVKGGVLIDDVHLTSQSPLFTDTDNDGLPDDYEKANGLDPFVANGAADLDDDGVSNFEEFARGTSPARHERKLGRAPPAVYVDNVHGSDAHSGHLSYALAADGPKASVKAAMTTAEDGATIVILPGSGVYSEGSRGISGKALTILPIGNPTIK